MTWIGSRAWLYDRQLEGMVEQWRNDHPGQEPDGKTTDTLRIQARMIIDDVQRSQHFEEIESLYPSGD